MDSEDNSRRWCSTETDENGEHVSGKDKYGFCLDTCPVSLNIGMDIFKKENIPIHFHPCSINHQFIHSFSDDFVVLNEALPDKQTTICDFTACNGLLMKFAESTGLKDTLGQCSVYDLDGESFCFVNEDSSCPKLAYDGKPGSFISTKPCTDPRAPSAPRAPRNPRFLLISSIGMIIAATTAVSKATAAVVTVGVGVGAAVGSVHIAKALKEG